MNNRFKTFFLAAQKEILEDRVLSFYGMVLSFVHVVAFIFRSNFPQVMTNRNEVFCWPFFSSCAALRTESATIWYLFAYLYVLISVLGVFNFYFKKVERAYWFLLSATVMNIFILLQDYSFMGNFHWMHLLVCLAFLFVPGKRLICQLLTVFFYLSAGTLKLNPEWLGGYSVGRPLPWGGRTLLVLGCYYVVVLELIVVLGLFSRMKWLKWGALSQLIFFHLISYYWVGYFYPVVMLGLLSIFPLSWRLDPQAKPQKFAVNRAQGSVLLILIIGQLLPPFLFADPAKVGWHRLSSLNMFDARLECINSFIIKSKNKTVDFEVENYRYGIRVGCDPVLFLNQAQLLCQSSKSDPDFLNLDLHLVSRRSSEANYQVVLREIDYCGRK